MTARNPPPHNLRCGVDTPWPIVARQHARLSSSQKQRLDAIAKARLDAQPTLKDDWLRQTGTAPGWSAAPTLYLEDHRAIQLSTEKSAKSFEYRSLGLAGDEDILLVSTPRHLAFETYMRETAGLGAPHILEVPALSVQKTQRLAKACLLNTDLLDALAKTALQFGSLNIVPFYSTGDIWLLAQETARRASRPVRVAAPTPELSAHANNKLWFADLVRTVIGKRALPTSAQAHNLTQAVARLRRFAARSQTVIVKLPSSAGSMGNLRWASQDLRELRAAALRDMLLDNLRTIGWRQEFPLLLSVWEDNVIASPSVQIWAPRQQQGDPVIEGTFVQYFSESSGGFAGAEAANLETPALACLHDEALQIAYVLQRIGYFGRLSLDAILLAQRSSIPAIRWIEANARWGGVSIPMTVANRKPLARAGGSLLIVQQAQKSGTFPDFSTIEARLQGRLVSMKAGRSEGIVFLSPPERGNLSFMVLGREQQDAHNLAQHVMDLTVPDHDAR